MSFFEAVSSGFRNCVNFSGRAVRSEYWYWALFATPVVAALPPGEYVVEIDDRKIEFNATEGEILNVKPQWAQHRQRSPGATTKRLRVSTSRPQFP
jgi:hypothetical protein